MSEWLLTYDEYKPEEERHREALCTCGNGYFATRGAAPETRADGTHYPGTYVAGIFDRRVTTIDDQSVPNESIVNVPNWLPLTFRVDGGTWFHIDDVEVLDFAQEFDAHRGILTRRVRFRDDEGRTTSLAQRRFVHMSQPHLAGLETTILAEDWSGRVTVRSGIDGTVENTLVERYQALESDHMEPVEAGEVGDEGIWLVNRTLQSRILIAVAARTRLLVDGELRQAERRVSQQPGFIEQEIEFDAEEGRPFEIEKVAAIYTSRDDAISEPALEARKHLLRCDDFDELLSSHVLAWDQLVRRFRLGIDRPEDEQMMVNVHVAHLLEVVSENTIDLDVGVPARGLHGEAYRGHIFWDELFIFPFLNYRLPALTRSLLRYRFRRLDEARWAAAQAGYRGAMYPWQSGSNGREEAQVLHLNPRSGRWNPDNTHLQRHINVAIAYNVWQYYQITGDLDFMSFFGAEMLLEIARFWASIATFDKVRDRYVILGVMGPDEFHDAYPDADEPGLNNNAYTNVMAAWVLCRALELLEQLPRPQRRIIEERLGLRREELEDWEEISRRMFVPFHDGWIISQFEGYDDLEEFDWDGYREKYGDIQRLDRILEAEGDTPNRYKVSKQADVLMLFYLLSSDELCPLFERLDYDLPREDIPRIIDYYVHRTSHGSTLSGVVHSWVLARRDRTRSWDFFKRALISDITDIQGGTTEEGIHLGAMAGSIDMLQRGYPGLEPRAEVLWMDPVLPDDLGRLKMRIQYREQWMDLDMNHERLVVSAIGGPAKAARIGLNGEVHEVRPGKSLELPLKQELGARAW